MPLYYVRWSGGAHTLAAAPSRAELEGVLAEDGDVTGARLCEIADSFAFDFRMLGPDVAVEASYDGTRAVMAACLELADDKLIDGAEFFRDA